MTSAEQNVPIFRLPDELLMDIFSYIAFIPEKMKLEQVSKRVQSVSSHSQSWKGIHKLELMMKCIKVYGDTMNNQLLEKKGNCNSANISLNGICVPFAHWPAAIKLLLKRTHINELIIHCGNDIDLFRANPTVIPNVNELLKCEKYYAKMKCSSVELHFGSLLWSLPTDGEALSVEQSIASIFTTSLQISTPHLTEFVLDVNAKCMYTSKILKKSIIEMWPIIKECDSLKSFTYSVDVFLPSYLKMLIGKPLQKVELFIAMCTDDDDYAIHVDDLIQIINEATGSGVQTLSVFDWENDDLKYFCDGLNEMAREKLKYINIARFHPAEPKDLRHHHLIPSIFPNLVKVQISSVQFAEEVEEEFYTMLVSFLNVAHAQSSSGCELEIRALWDSIEDYHDFREDLANACQNAQINVQFDEFPFEVLLSKGNSAIAIRKVT